MQTTEAFFEDAKKAGMTKPASWAPSGGGALQAADVIFHASNENVFGGEVSSTNYRIQYAASALVGLKRGEVVTVAGVQYTVRESPVPQLDGTRLEASLRKGL